TLLAASANAASISYNFDWPFLKSYVNTFTGLIRDNLGCETMHPMTSFYLMAGALDTKFATAQTGEIGADATVRALGIQGDGKLIIGGDFTNLFGSNRPRLSRLNPDGSPDNATFLTGLDGPDGNVNAVAIDQDVPVVVG